jgi:adenylylsulfate kinase-like enzyme
MVRREVTNFVECYVEVTLDEVIQRDVKGLYKKALAGEIPNFTGVNDPYEPPLKPEIVVKTHEQSEAESLQVIITALEKAGLI